ncbi:MAG: RNA polymerase factor sigma-54 [Rikenellaceae bacterium]|nr:RNA polymerase factor sigma-54 [Rikenellaceae bacterium]
MATSLSLTQQQKLQVKLSPAQIQVMRMLELPACELQARINEELQENPALEEGRDQLNDNEYADTDNTDDEYLNPLQNDDFNYDDYVQDDDISERATSQNRSVEAMREEVPFSVGISFGEYLKSQIYLTKMDKPDRHIAKFVVGNIDSDGYLRRTAEELVDDINFQENLNVTDEKMREIIEQIRTFDPPGVAARDLQDCLLMQLKLKEQTPSVVLATNILSRMFDAFTRKQYTKIIQRFEITEDDLRMAIAEIVHLSPRPSNNWSGTVYDRNQTTVNPDFIVEQEDEELIVSLNQGDVPSLHVSQEYSQMLEYYAAKNEAKKSDANRETTLFIKSKIEAAHNFIDALRQRNETLMQTMTAIVAYQREFFLQGDSSFLRPMVLKDIAEIIKLDVSTVSRVCNNKYVQTQFGIFPLKHFFSEAITKQDGGEISTREIKEAVRELIAAEDKSRPITDDELVELLHQKGYSIARRTVAKYREQLGIPVARLRHQI